MAAASQVVTWAQSLPSTCIACNLYWSLVTRVNHFELFFIGEHTDECGTHILNKNLQNHDFSSFKIKQKY